MFKSHLQTEAEAVSGEAITPTEGKFIYQAAQKLPDSTPKAAQVGGPIPSPIFFSVTILTQHQSFADFRNRQQAMLIKYLYAADPAHTIASRPKFDAALQYLIAAGDAPDEGAFRVSLLC